MRAGVRELARDDLPAVAALYERVVRSGSERPAPGLVEYFDRLLFGPLSDPQVPPLVFVDGEGRVVAFLATYTRWLRTRDGRHLRVGCSGQLVSDPEARMPGSGALLLRKFLAGPQDLTITDGATGEVAAMWRRLGGRIRPLESLAWVRVLRPLRAGISYALRRRQLPRGERLRRGRLVGRLGDLGDEPLTPDVLSALLEERLEERAAAPVCDPDFAAWLLGELERTSGARGSLLARHVRDADNRSIGCYVAFVPRGGRAQVLAVLARSGQEGVLLDRLFTAARACGAISVEGRAESHLFEALVERRVLFRAAERALVHARDPQLLRLVLTGDVLLTRLDGEWWMSHHLDPLPTAPPDAPPPGRPSPLGSGATSDSSAH